MKKLFLFLSIPFSLQAQSDSLKVTFSEEKVEKFEKTTLIDEYEKAFGGNRVVKSGLRVFASDPGLLNYQNLDLQYEQKIGKSISIIGSLGNTFQISGPTDFILNFETRYYFNMKKRNQNEIQKPNITGNYLSLKLEYFPNEISRLGNGYNVIKNNNQIFGGIPSEIFLESGNISVNLGKQFGNTLSMSLQLGVKKGNIFSPYNTNYSDYGKIQKSIFFTTQNQIGIGLLMPRSKWLNSNYCEFLKCNFDLKKMWKLNLNNAFYIDKYNQNLKFDIAFERKLKSTPFSLNSNLILGVKNIQVPKIISFKDTTTFDQNGKDYTFQIPIYSTKESNQPNYNFSIKEQLRYYIGMKEKARKGKQGNNLNGVYTGLEYMLNFNKVSLQKFSKSYYPERVDVRALSGIIGYQTLTNKNSFFDINIALGVEAVKSYPNYLSGWLGQTHFELGIKLGLAK